AQGAGGRQLAEGDRRRIESQREDCGSAQIQSHAQVGYSQQSSTGAVRDPEEDHPDSVRFSLIRWWGRADSPAPFRPADRPDAIYLGMPAYEYPLPNVGHVGQALFVLFGSAAACLQTGFSFR